MLLTRVTDFEQFPPPTSAGAGGKSNARSNDAEVDRKEMDMMDMHMDMHMDMSEENMGKEGIKILIEDDPQITQIYNEYEKQRFLEFHNGNASKECREWHEKMESRLRYIGAGVLEIYGFTKLVNPRAFPRYDKMYKEPHLDIVAKRSTLRIVDPPPSNQVYIWYQGDHRPIVNVGKGVEEWLRREYPEFDGTVGEMMLHHINPPEKKPAGYPCYSCGSRRRSSLTVRAKRTGSRQRCCVCGHPYSRSYF